MAGAGLPSLAQKNWRSAWLAAGAGPLTARATSSASIASGPSCSHREGEDPKPGKPEKPEKKASTASSLIVWVDISWK